MSDSVFADCGLVFAGEVSPGGAMQSEELTGQVVTMPFDPDTREAAAFRGAMSLLFTLIAFHGELIGQDAPANAGETRFSPELH